MSFFEKYIAEVTRNDVRTQRSVDAVLKRANELLQQDGPRVSGLVVGRVQSGKTRHYTGLALKAAEEGWNVILVLTSPIMALARQTQERLWKEFKAAGVTDSSSTRLKFLDGGEIDEPTSLDSRESHFYWGVAMKETACLGRVKGWLDVNRRHVSNMHMLVIDDEADNATPDSNGTRGVPFDSAEIAEQLAAMRACDEGGVDFAPLADWFDSQLVREWPRDGEGAETLKHLQDHIVTARQNAILCNARYRRLLEMEPAEDRDIPSLVRGYFNRCGRGGDFRSEGAFLQLLQSILGVDSGNSAINHAIRSIVGNAGAHGVTYPFARLAYLGYTATPYACILNERPGQTPLYADFIASIDKSPRYFGLEAIFGSNPGTEERPNVQPNMDIVRTIPERERNEVLLPIEGTSVRTNGASRPGSLTVEIRDDLSYVFNNLDGEEVPGTWDTLGEAVAWAFCTAAARRWIFAGEENRGIEHRWTTMLMNISQLGDVHERQRSLLERYINFCLATPESKQSFKRRCRTLWERETARFTIDQFNALFNANPVAEENYDKCGQPCGCAYLAWTHVEQNLDYFLQGAHYHVIVINSRNKDNQDLYVQANYYGRFTRPVQELQGEHLWFVVGGNTISRGLTLPGLTTSYFDRVRRSVAVDTLTQMGRWFGYREGYELLPRIWMTEETILEMKRTALVECRMHQSIQENFDRGFSPSDEAHYQQIYSWGRKLSGRARCQCDRTVGIGLYAGTTDFPKDPSRAEKIFKTVREFLERNEDRLVRNRTPGDAADAYLYQQHPLWSNVEDSRIQQLLHSLSPYYPVKSQLKINGLIDEIDRQPGRWDVVLGIPEANESRTFAFPHVPGVPSSVPAGHPRFDDAGADAASASSSVYVPYYANIQNEHLYREDVRILTEDGGKDVIMDKIRQLEETDVPRLRGVDAALSRYPGATREARLANLCETLKAAAEGECPQPIPERLRSLWRHTREMGVNYDRHAPQYMESVHKKAKQVRPMLMFYLLAPQPEHGFPDGLPFVALNVYWPKHAPDVFHAVSVGLSPSQIESVAAHRDE